MNDTNGQFFLTAIVIHMFSLNLIHFFFFICKIMVSLLCQEAHAIILFALIFCVHFHCLNE